jgi:D-arginine dehydrogenase
MSTPEIGERVETDICIVGGGIAGISLAAELARHARVVVLESEERPGTHATGRSAANYSETHSTAPVRALTKASLEFLLRPPDGFADSPLLTPRPLLYFGRNDQRGALDRLLQDAELAGAQAQHLSAVDAIALAPCLRADYVASAVLEPLSYDIDVDLLLQARLRVLRRADMRVLCATRMNHATRSEGRWLISSGDKAIQADVIVNAAGAWADDVAVRAGAKALGLSAKLRSVALLPVDGADIAAMPMCVDADSTFYFKPDAGRLLLSPMDETPQTPADAFADDFALAEAMERLTLATTFLARRPSHTWGGLRTFAPDRTPVIGFDTTAPGFFWLAGQGGAGIQTSPAASRLAAHLILGESAGAASPPVDPETVSPRRFRQ